MFLYPDHAKIPEWVEQRLNNFNKEIKEANNKKESKQLCLDSLEKNILYNEIKIVNPLTKNEIENIIVKLSYKNISDEEFMWYYWLLLNAGFQLSSQFPSSVDNLSFNIPTEFINKRNQMVKDFNDKKITLIDLDKGFKKITKEIINNFEKENISISDIINSGAAGSVESIRQMLVALGITINANRDLLEIIGTGLIEGQTQKNYFNQSSHAIKALYSKSADTAIPGYAGRKLATIMEHIKLSKLIDCGSKKGLNIKIENKELLKSVIGRFQIVEPTLLNRSGLKEITETDNLIGKNITIRSPLYCKAKDGICETCLNKIWIKNLNIRPGANIGLMASTFITGSMVNLTLKKSHTGIGLDLIDVDLLDEIEKIYE